MRLTACLLLAIVAFAAGDTWNKVREIKSGAELRIFKKNAKQPVIAKMDEANDERIVVVVKNEQVAIPKEEIDRLDARPLKTGSRFTTESKTTSNGPEADARQGTATTPYQHPGPSGSTSSNVTLGGKPDFETVYRRPLLTAPHPKPEQ